MNPLFENIPPELRALPQWVCAGSDKIPVNPRTGQRADPANPATGGTFAEAVQAGMKHVGFILGLNDPFAIIDLDNPFERVLAGVKSEIVEGDADFPQALEIAARHQKILEAFPTYAELSQSGKGVHLVMKGVLPCGVRRDKVELYANQRYIIFTGNVLRNAAVNDCQENLAELFRQIGSLVDDSGELIEEEETQPDASIWAMATRASNAEKFVALCQGEWSGLGYPSQSEADYALLSMLAFYSRSNEQIRRMFRQTHLANRTKATRNDVYLNRSLRRIRAREAPIVDVSALALIPSPPAPEAAPKPSEIVLDALPDQTGNPFGNYTFPPGLVGDVARYVLSSAIRPVPEVALAAAVALCAGICARSYNISGTGLNQYIIVLAKTGRGKEGAASGIDQLIAAVRQGIPMADQFLGPAAFASGQALVKVLDRVPCFVSILGEFGLTLQQICDPQANPALVMLRRVLLDIYAKSGFSKVLRSSVYSDSDKNTKVIQAPNVSLLGESTPETFFNGLDISHIAEGLIPRFSIIEYKGPRPATNPNAFHPPGETLVAALGQFITVAVTTQQNHTVCPVRMEPEAKTILDALNNEADRRINEDGSEVEAELWNRAHLKGLKIAALIAAGCNPHAPAITGEIAAWGVAFVRREIGGIMERFQSGEVGNGEAKQEAELRRLFKHFQTLSPEQRLQYRCPDGLLDRQVVPFQYFNIYTRRLACFKNDKRGAGRALADTLATMVKTEAFEMIPLQQLTSEFKTRSPIYYPGPAW